MELLKAIKAAKDVYIDVPLNATSIWVRVNKKELIESLTIAEQALGGLHDQIEIVTQYGKSAIYLCRKIG